MQRFTYGTATPNMAIAWYWQGQPEQLQSWRPDDYNAPRTPVEGPIRIVGGSSRPWIHYTDQPYHVLIAVFRPDAMRKWFDLDPSAWMDRAASLDDLGNVAWAGWAREIQAANEPDAALSVLYKGLLDGRAGCAGPGPRPLTSDQWLDKVAYSFSVRSDQRGASARSLQRGLKQVLGLPLRQARKMARLESLSITTAATAIKNDVLDLPQLAHEVEYYDQSHMNRHLREATGFSTAESIRRSFSDESFWLIRAFYSIFFKSLVSKPFQRL